MARKRIEGARRGSRDHLCDDVEMSDKPLTFWEHLDQLRLVVFKVAAVTTAVGVLAFCFKDALFAVVLAPDNASFPTYRLFDDIGTWICGLVGCGAESASEGGAEFHVRLINTELAQQFIIHLKVAFYAGVIAASPYILYQVFKFISPALYADERKYVRLVVVSGYALFLLGALFGYFVIFPFTFRFLGTYQVSGNVENTITLESYVSALTVLVAAMGVVFEMPAVSWILAKLRVLKAEYMTRYRRHVIVAIFITAAIITPTTDAFTLTIVAVPMWMLYELSVWIVGKTNRSNG